MLDWILQGILKGNGIPINYKTQKSMKTTVRPDMS